MELNRQLALENIEQCHQHIIIGLDSSPVFLIDVEQTIKYREALLESVQAGLITHVILALRAEIPQRGSAVLILDWLYVDVSLSTHEDVKHDCVVVSPFQLPLGDQLLHPADYVKHAHLSHVLQALHYVTPHPFLPGTPYC